MHKKEAGMSFLGMLLLLAVGGLLAYTAMRVAPMYMEFWTIESTLKSVAEKARIEQFSNAEIRKSFDKILDVNTIDVVSSRDLRIDVGPEGTTLSTRYSKCVPFVDRLDLCGNFEAKFTFPTH